MEGRLWRMREMVKVRFGLARDDDGWPPAESEGLWAEPLGDDLYRVDNVPWFARSLSADDVVKALAGSDGVLWAIECVQWSGRHTVRVIPLREGPLRGEPAEVVGAFEPLGVSAEVALQYRMVALDIAADAPLEPIKALLRQGERDGWWDYEEGCVSQIWLDL